MVNDGVVVDDDDDDDYDDDDDDGDDGEERWGPAFMKQNCDQIQRWCARIAVEWWNFSTVSG